MVVKWEQNLEFGVDKSRALGSTLQIDDCIPCLNPSYKNYPLDNVIAFLQNGNAQVSPVTKRYYTEIILFIFQIIHLETRVAKIGVHCFSQHVVAVLFVCFLFDLFCHSHFGSLDSNEISREETFLSPFKSNKRLAGLQHGLLSWGSILLVTIVFVRAFFMFFLSFLWSKLSAICYWQYCSE